MTDRPLILSCYSLRHAGFEERVAAAAAAGFAGIGLNTGWYERLRAEGWSDADLRAVLDAYGQRVLEIEVLRGWGTTGAAYGAYRRQLAVVLAMHEALGPVHHVQAIGPYDGSLDEGATAFAALCEATAAAGLPVALEFLPQMSNVPDARAAWELVRRAGHPNGGLCVDAWHHERSGGDWAGLAEVPGERVFAVQIDDGPSTPVDPDYYTDCTRYRLPPGQGDFDLVRLLRTLDAMGVTAPVSVEVISVELERRPAEEVARLLAASTRAVLAAA